MKLAFALINGESPRPIINKNGKKKKKKKIRNQQVLRTRLRFKALSITGRKISGQKLVHHFEIVGYKKKRFLKAMMRCFDLKLAMK